MQGGGTFNPGGGGGGSSDNYHYNDHHYDDHRYNDHHRYSFDTVERDRCNDPSDRRRDSSGDCLDCCCCLCGCKACCDEGKVNYKVLFAVHTFWLATAAIIAGLVVKFSYSNGGSLNLAKGDQQLISTGVLPHFCESVTIESVSYNVSYTTYFFDTKPEIVTTNLISQNFSAVLTVPANNAYKFFAFNLLRGTTVHLRICSTFSHIFYLIRGTANLNKFSSGDACSNGCYIATLSFAALSDSQCKGKFGIIYSYIADESDVYYHVITSAGDAEYFFEMKRPSYSLQGGTEVRGNPAHVDFPSWTATRHVLVDYSKDATSDSMEFRVACNPRLAPYFIYFLAIPIAILFIIIGIVFLIARSKG